MCTWCDDMFSQLLWDGQLTAILAFDVLIGSLNTLSCWKERVCLNFQCLSVLLFCKCWLSALSSYDVGRCLLMVMPDTIHLFISVKIPYILYSDVDFVFQLF